MGIFDGVLTSVALCWRIERTDGCGIGLTSHDLPLLSDGVFYDATPGIVPASITRALGLEPNSSEISGALTSAALAEEDLELGRWNGAGVQLNAVDWDDPATDPVTLLAGEIGSVTIDDSGFTADLSGSAAKLQQAVCPATSAECRASFGDKQCRIDLAGRTIAATVVTSNGSELTLDQTIDDGFVLGRIRYMSGANCGLSSVILSVNGAAVQVRDLPRAAVEPGCHIELREGCDKRFETCVSRFDNAANFRGEPHLPGNDLLTRYPGA
jgi:uncharacterized phage protein (TIGR02218 family)